MPICRESLKAAALAAYLLAGSVVPANAGFGFGGESYPKIQKPVSFDPNVAHDADAQQFVWVNKPDGAKGISKVVIPFFQVQFVTRSHADASVDGGGTSSSLIMRLDGPTTEQMQQIVDALHARLMAKLRAAGIEVVDPNSAQSYAAFGEMRANMKPSGDSVDGMGGITSTFVSPTGLGWYLLPTSKPEYAGGGSFSVMGNIAMVKREQKLLEQSGAAVLGFRAVVDFASLKSSDNGAFGRHGLTAWTKGRAGLAIRPVSTQMFLVAPNAKGTMMDPQSRLRLELQTPLVIDSAAIKTIANSTSTGQKVGAALGSVISILGGGGGQSVKQFDVQVDQKAWGEDVGGALNGVVDMMVAKVAVMR